MNPREHIKQRVLIAGPRGLGGRTEVIEVKFLEVSPSGQWVKLMNLQGNKYWQPTASLGVVEVLEDLSIEPKPAETKETEKTRPNIAEPVQQGSDGEPLIIHRILEGRLLQRYSVQTGELLDQRFIKDYGQGATLDSWYAQDGEWLDPDDEVVTDAYGDLGKYEVVEPGVMLGAEA